MLILKILGVTLQAVWLTLTIILGREALKYRKKLKKLEEEKEDKER